MGSEVLMAGVVKLWGIAGVLGGCLEGGGRGRQYEFVLFAIGIMLGDAGEPGDVGETDPYPNILPVF